MDPYDLIGDDSLWDWQHWALIALLVGAVIWGWWLVSQATQEKQAPEARTDEEKLALLDWHPMFTGRCPNCEMPLHQTDPPRVHWDCEHCGWVDDSI